MGEELVTVSVKELAKPSALASFLSMPTATEQIQIFFGDDDNAVKVFKRTLIDAVNNSPNLQACSIGTIFDRVKTVCQFGLSVNPKTQEALLVPTRNKDGSYSCTLILGYRGYIKMAYKSGRVVYAYAVCVYKGEDFIIRRGTSPSIEHEPDYSVERTPDNMVAAYAVAFPSDKLSPVWFDVMSRSEIEDVKRFAVNKGGGPDRYRGAWVSDFTAMAEKSAIRKLFDSQPIFDDKVRETIESDYAEDGMVVQSTDALLPVRKTGTSAVHDRLDAQDGISREYVQEPVSENVPESGTEDPLSDVQTMEPEPEPEPEPVDIDKPAQFEIDAVQQLARQIGLRKGDLPTATGDAGFSGTLQTMTREQLVSVKAYCEKKLTEKKAADPLADEYVPEPAKPDETTEYSLVSKFLNLLAPGESVAKVIKTVLNKDMPEGGDLSALFDSLNEADIKRAENFIRVRNKAKANVKSSASG